MNAKNRLMAIALTSCAAFGSSAHAAEGAVKVDCDNCDAVSLGTTGNGTFASTGARMMRSHDVQ
ncbi:MAG: hypothetical protein ACREXS_14620 [Gammaproteobacteria bacterium]